MPIGGCDGFEARMVAMHINGMVPGGFVAVSVYLNDGIGATGLNLELLATLGSFLASLTTPWVVAGELEHGTRRASGKQVAEASVWHDRQPERQHVLLRGWGCPGLFCPLCWLIR